MIIKETENMHRIDAADDCHRQRRFKPQPERSGLGVRRQARLDRHKNTGTWPSNNVRNIRHSLRGTSLPYVLIGSSVLPEDNRTIAKGCSSFLLPCPRTQGIVCNTNWYYASRPSWKNSFWLNPA